jgi:hypothetical protein
MYSKKYEFGSELKEKTSATSVIAAKSTVVPLPKAHLDTKGACMFLFFFSRRDKEIFGMHYLSFFFSRVFSDLHGASFCSNG